MQITDTLSDEALLAELGLRISRRRIAARLTQSQAAREAGISKRTVERIENGASAQLSSVIRLLRALNLLAGLNALVPAEGPSPMELLRNRGKRRVRVSGKRGSKKAPDWTWGDDDS